MELDTLWLSFNMKLEETLLNDPREWDEYKNDSHTEKKDKATSII